MSLRDTHKIKDIIYKNLIEYFRAENRTMYEFENMSLSIASLIEDYFIKRRESRVILEKLWEEDFDEQFPNLIQLHDNNADGFNTLVIEDMREPMKKFIRGLFKLPIHYGEDYSKSNIGGNDSEC